MQVVRKKRVNSARVSSLRLPAAVEIVAPWQVAGGEVALVGIDVAGEAARDRPDGAGIERFQQRGVRHQPRDAAVAVEERVNPGEAVMCRRRRKDRLGLAELAVDLFEALQKARHGGRADGDVPADRDIAVAQFAGDDLDLFFRRRVFDPEQIFGQQFAEAAMDFADGVRRDGAALETAAVDPLLDRDVRFGLELEVALLAVLAVVVLEGALDIDRVRVVPFDQVAVVAVHRAHEIGE